MKIRFTIDIETGEDEDGTKETCSTYFLGEYGDSSNLLGLAAADQVREVLYDMLRTDVPDLIDAHSETPWVVGDVSAEWL